MPNVNVSTARLGFSSAAASLLVAMLAPILGAIADQGGVRKRLLIGFAYPGGADARSPFFVGKGQWAWAVFIYVLGSIGFAGANVLYNALLPQVAGEDRVDRVSSFGYALGYLGGDCSFCWMSV